MFVCMPASLEVYYSLYAENIFPFDYADNQHFFQQQL